MKVQRIYVEDFKAVDTQEIVLNGCSAIVTAGNNRGKTSVLAGLRDRFMSQFPDKKVREGAENGQYVMDLDDGAKIEWHFTEKSERFTYITPDGIKQTTGVIRDLGKKYFGKKFDIDEFLNLSPKPQQKWLERVANIDLSEVDHRYQQAYEDRTDKNKEVKRLQAMDLSEPEQVEQPDIAAIKTELQEAREQNEQHREAAQKKERLESLAEEVLLKIELTPFKPLFDREQAQQIIDDIEIPDKRDTDAIEQRLEEANEQLRQYDSYERDRQEYEQWQDNLQAAKQAAEKADEQVKAIEQEKQDLIANADLPEGFDITENGLTYNGFPLDDNQISASSKYIAALKLGERVLGEVRTLHFDASNLDRHSLQEVQDWAESKDLQLLIERPDFEGGEIQYELIQQNGSVSDE